MKTSKHLTLGEVLRTPSRALVKLALLSALLLTVALTTGCGSDQNTIPYVNPYGTPTTNWCPTPPCNNGTNFPNGLTPPAGYNGSFFQGQLVLSPMYAPYVYVYGQSYWVSAQSNQQTLQVMYQWRYSNPGTYFINVYGQTYGSEIVIYATY